MFEFSLHKLHICDADTVTMKSRPLPKLRTFHAAGLDGLDLYAISPADAAAEAFANLDNQVYFGKDAIALKEGMPCWPAATDMY